MYTYENVSVTVSGMVLRKVYGTTALSIRLMVMRFEHASDTVTHKKCTFRSD